MPPEAPQRDRSKRQAELPLAAEDSARAPTDRSASLRVASWVAATEAEGPGWRFALWTQGCSLRCPDCCNPHLWTTRGAQAWSLSDLWERIEAARRAQPLLEGISLLGGEPFEQDLPLARLARRCRRAGLTVMAYSGYRLAELRARGAALLEHVDLLVDGRYERALRTTQRRWIGSENQELHFLSPAYDPADPRFQAPNHAELRLNDQGELQVIGFPFEAVQAAFGPGSPRV